MFNTASLKTWIQRICPMLVLFIIFSTCDKGPSNEEKAIIAAIDQFFHAMTVKDTTEARNVLHPEGRFFSVRENGTIRSQPHLAFIEGLASSQDVYLERMWEPKILIHERIAMVWAPYDFHRNGNFSHCGIDAFSLLKTTEGWKIAGIVYTVEPTGCKESPLRPPG